MCLCLFSGKGSMEGGKVKIRTCPTCHSRICHGISVYDSAGSLAVSKRGRGKTGQGQQRGASAVMACLYDTKSPGLREVGALESEKDTEAKVSFSCLDKG